MPELRSFKLRQALIYIERAERVICRALLIFILGVAAWHAQPTMESIKESASSSTEVSQQGLNLVGSATSLIGNSTQKKAGTLFGVVDRLDQLAAKLGSMADAGTGTIAKGGKTLDAGTALIVRVNQDVTKAEPAAAETKEKIDKLIDAYAGVPSHFNPALDGLLPVESSLANTTTALGDFINSPRLARLIQNLGTASGNAGELIDNTNSYLYPPPYAGPHPVRHRFAVVGRGVLKFSPPVVSGIAGGIALSKGN